MGGATRYAILRGEGRREEANRVSPTPGALAAVLGIVFTGAGLLFSWQIAGRWGPQDRCRSLQAFICGPCSPFPCCFWAITFGLLCPQRRAAQPGHGGHAGGLPEQRGAGLSFSSSPWAWGMFRRGFGYLRGALYRYLNFRYPFSQKEKQVPACPVRAQRKISQGDSLLGVSSFITEVSSGVVMLIFNQIILPLAGNVGGSGLRDHRQPGADRGVYFYRCGTGIQPIVSVNFGSGQMGNVKRYSITAW